MLDDLEAEVLEYLHGMDAQMVSEVSRALKAKPVDVRQALHNLTATGDVALTKTRDGLELFEAAHGGYLPKGWTA